MDLINLLKGHEGKQLEFKENMSSPKKMLETIVAFSNTAGGVLLIGVEDETKNIVGINNPLKEEERLANLIHDTIRPMLVPSIEILNWKGTNIIKIEVQLSSIRPHYIASKGKENGVYIRIGSSNRRADICMIDEIHREVQRKPFEDMPLVEYSSSDIDTDAFSSVFEGKRKTSRQDLEVLNLVVSHQGKKVPTVGGMLLFGKSRGRAFPDAWIHCGRFSGKNKSIVIDNVEIHSYPLLAVNEALDFVKKHSSLSYEFKGAQRDEVWSKPLVAIREAIINAVVHADYSQQGSPVRVSIFDDKIEIENPGILLSGLTVEEIQKGVSKLRNRTLARVFKEAGLVEQWGSGLMRMKDTCEELGLPIPEYEELGTHFRVTIYTQRKNVPLVDKVDKEILEVVVAAGGLATRSIFEKINFSRQGTINRLKVLQEKGLLTVVGKSANDPRRKYIVTKTGEKALE